MYGQTLLKKKMLSTEEKKRLLLILAEMKSRGLPIPAGLELPDSTTDIHWNLDENGYFIKVDGTKFSPRKVLTDFISDPSRFILLKSGRGGGKALHVGTPILTYNRGWVTMGDLVVGDYVFDPSGTPTEVIFTSGIYSGDECYSVKFSDGSEIIADGEHLWKVFEKDYRGIVSEKVLTTKELHQASLVNSRNLYKYNIPVSNPLYFPEAELPLHPYVLGAWLGDGSSRDSSITTDPKDFEILDNLSKFGWPTHPTSEPFTWGLSYRGNGGSKFRDIVYNLGVWKNKHIPDMYFCSSISQRQLLLQGLMDTDGTISQRGHCSFDNKNYKLALGVYELVTGLGIKATLSRYEITQFSSPTWSYKVAFSVPDSFSVFLLSRKANRQKATFRSDIYTRAIVSVTPTKSCQVQCIEVDSPRHLFLAGKSLIATHNTTAGVQKALMKLKQGESGAVMSPDFENFKQSTWPELQQWIPWSMVVPKHRYRASPSWEAIRPFTIVFMNGARMYCKGLKDPESARGANLNWFWYDEGRRDPTGLGWKNAIAFLRVGDNPQAWCTTTMASLDHWTNTFFMGEVTGEIAKIIKELKESGLEQNLFSIYKTSPKENDALDPMFLASLISAYPSGYLRQREIDGEAADEGGSLGTREWFENKELPEIPDWAVRFTRFWDLAATEKKILKGKKLNDPDETVGSLLGTDSEKDVTKKKFVVCDQAGGYLAWKQLKEFVLDVARRDINKLGMVTICFEQEPASGGKNQVAELKEFLEKELKKRWGITTNQFKVEALEAKKLGDRVLAANTWFSEANNGQFYYVKGVWNEKFFGQLDTFDGLRHDDRITSVTGARHNIAPIQNKFRDMEFLAL